MIKRIRSNPIANRLIQQGRWPSPRQTLGIFSALTVIGLGATITGLAADPEAYTCLACPSFILVPTGLVLLIFTSPLSAVLTTIMIVQDAQSESYQLIRASSLPRNTIVMGYWLAALYRLRFLWALGFGLILPVIVAMTQMFVALEIEICCWDCVGCSYPVWEGMWLRNLKTSSIVGASGALLWIALNALAISLAVWSSIHWRNLSLALGLTLSVIGLGVVLQFGGLVLLLGNLLFDSEFPASAFSILIAVLCFALLCLSLSIGLYRSAIQEM
jgi:hypothetical protein